MTKKLHVVALGHALVDIIAPCDDSFLADFGLAKGTMRLTSAQEAAALYEKMAPSVETSGGSAAKFLLTGMRFRPCLAWGENPRMSS